MNLRQLQALFVDAIVYPTGVDDFLAQADEDTRTAFGQHFVTKAVLDALACLAFQQAYQLINHYRLHAAQFAGVSFLQVFNLFFRLGAQVLVLIRPRKELSANHYPIQ